MKDLFLLLINSIAACKLLDAFQDFDARYGSIISPEGVEQLKQLDLSLKPLEDCTDDELDEIFTAEIGHRAWHRTRESYIETIKHHRENGN